MKTESDEAVAKSAEEVIASAGTHSAAGSARASVRRRDAPAEMPSTMAVSRFRAAVAAPNRLLRDPRFEPATGKFDAALFRANYSFLGEYKESEIAALRAELGACREPSRRAELAALLAQSSQQRNEEVEREAVRAALTKRKREEAAAVAAGKKPFFLKRADLKKVVAEERFRLLQEKGGAAAVDRALQRRRKKLLGKEKRSGRLPAPRRTATVPGGDREGGDGETRQRPFSRSAR